MKKNQVIQAWRDPEFYFNLSEEERARMPVHPAGVVEIEDDALNSLTGGCGCNGGGDSAMSTSCFTCACTPQWC